jgi:hypothetical protein
MRLSRYALLFIGLFTSSLTLADTTSLSNFYAGGTIGVSDTGWSELSGLNYDSTGMGLNLTGGYILNNTWSFEANYFHYADATSSTHTSESTNALGGFAKLSVPLGSTQFRFFSKMGFSNSFNSGHVNTSLLSLTMGYGLDLPLQDNLMGEVEYLHTIGTYSSPLLPNIDYYGIGVIYRLPNNLFE